MRWLAIAALVGFAAVFALWVLVVATAWLDHVDRADVSRLDRLDGPRSGGTNHTQTQPNSGEM